MKFSNFFQQQEKNHARELVKRFSLMIGALIIVIIFARGLWQLYEKSTVLHEERQKKEAELAALAKERNRLDTEIAYLKSTGALEREAKARLNYKRSGEEVVIVVPEADQNNKGTATASPETGSSIWTSIKTFFLTLLYTYK